MEIHAQRPPSGKRGVLGRDGKSDESLRNRRKDRGSALSRGKKEGNRGAFRTTWQDGRQKRIKVCLIYVCRPKSEEWLQQGSGEGKLYKACFRSLSVCGNLGTRPLLSLFDHMLLCPSFVCMSVLFATMEPAKLSSTYEQTKLAIRGGHGSRSVQDRVGRLQISSVDSVLASNAHNFHGDYCHLLSSVLPPQRTSHLILIVLVQLKLVSSGRLN